ncbi:MAG: LysM peptidoglycan-binding domain-containing protein [Paenirhodobacter sp.]|uniref:LysM peptidoglycan-binding domain-containing protein n=1 Tax=Paenirhodobacter sp. TaxID=1965326 RepID=UPI003D14CA38
MDTGHETGAAEQAATGDAAARTTVGATGGAAAGGGQLRGALAGGLAAAAVVAVGVIWWVLGTPVPTPEPAAETGAAQEEAQALATAPQPAAEAEAPQAAAPEPAPAPEPAQAEAPAAEAPDVARFDALRVTPDGALTLAGKAAPGAKVEVLLDGAVIDTVTAGPQGAFASVVLGAPSASPRALTLRVTGADGVARTTAQSLTVAPSPQAVAQAATAEGDAPEAVSQKVAAAQALAETPIESDGANARLLAGASDALVIDTLSFGATGRIALSGRGAPEGALLRAYVDNDEAGLVQAGGSGAWQMELPAAKPGAHTLRIDALDAAGKVLARAETPFEAVAPADLAAAAGAAPVTGAVTGGARVSGAGQKGGMPEAAPAAAATPEAELVPGPAAPAVAAPGPAAGRPRMVTIETGNTLWAIARDTYGDPYLYVRLFEANRDQIRNPDLIYPGQVFTLPE